MKSMQSARSQWRAAAKWPNNIIVLVPGDDFIRGVDQYMRSSAARLMGSNKQLRRGL